MAVVEDLICKGQEGSLCFGNFLLDTKTKKSNFEYEGDLYKIKTFREITKLEKNGLFIYESVPGTAVTNFKNDGNTVEFIVESFEDTAITLELEQGTEYEVIIGGEAVGRMQTNLGGKLNIGVELNAGEEKDVKIVKCQ